MKFRSPIIFGTLCLFYWAPFPRMTFGCDVPVFRYALERWPVGVYELTVFYREPLGERESAIVNQLRQVSVDEQPSVPFRLTTVGLDGTAVDGLGPEILPDGVDPPDLPCMVLYPPKESGNPAPVWTGSLTASNAAGLPDSPARREVARRILDGDTAVWALLESGDADQDAAARGQLEKSLEELEETLEPSQGTYEPGIVDTGPPVEIRFSILSVSRTDPAEAVLVAMLLGCEPDLGEFLSYPMAFPIYGRGRALYALVGKGINHENIEEACQFLVGPCSCEAKLLNPGTDLLIAADWEAGLEIRTAEYPPSLVSLASLADAAVGDDKENAAAERTAEDTNEPASPKAANPIVRNLLFVIGLFIVVIAILSFRILKPIFKGTT